MPKKRKFESASEHGSPSDLYKILQVPWGASQREIVQGYYRMALQVHPDKGGDAKKFQEVAHAYEVLSDAGLRHQYDTSVLEHGHCNGLNPKTFANAGKRPVAHVLADFSEEMVQLLLAAPCDGWQQLLEGCSRTQLGRLLDCLSTLARSTLANPQHIGKKRGRAAIESTVAHVCNADLSGTKYLSKRGNSARAEFYIRGLNVESPHSQLIPVLAFYHSAVVQLRTHLLQSLQAKPDVSMETAMSEALKALAPTGFQCRWTFRSRKYVEGENHYTPLVDDWPVALEMHLELQQAASGQQIKALQRRWKQKLQESKGDLEARRLQKANELRGYILCQQEVCCDVRTLPLRRHGKQPAECVKVPLAELRRILERPDGKMALMQLLAPSDSRLALPAPLPHCGWAQMPKAEKATVFAFTSVVDLARFAAAGKASWQEVRAHLDKAVLVLSQDSTTPLQKAVPFQSRLLHRFRERCSFWRSPSTNHMHPHPAVR
eukprot:Skav226777  [mRNA]  locus=scaffold8:270824:272293:- [translate_table: standard]